MKKIKNFGDFINESKDEKYKSAKIFGMEVFREMGEKHLTEEEYDNDKDFHDNITKFAEEYYKEKNGDVETKDIQSCITSMSDELKKIRAKVKAKKEAAEAKKAQEAADKAAGKKVDKKKKSEDDDDDDE